MSKLKKILNIIFEKKEEIKFEPTVSNSKKKEEVNLINKEKMNKYENPSKGYNYGNIKKAKDKKEEFITVTKLSKYFKIEPNALNKIFIELRWAKREDRWIFIRELGERNGAKECYDTRSKVKYLRWKELVKNNCQLIEAVEKFKKIKPKSNKEKGDEYESFIAEYYKGKGYFVWEHGKEKGRLDQGIDLIIKKDKEIIFIQCKNWRENTRFKIDHVRVKASRAEARQFILDNPLFNKGYKNKFRYTISSDCMHPSAIKYIEETNGLFDYEIIGMK